MPCDTFGWNKITFDKDSSISRFDIHCIYIYTMCIVSGGMKLLLAKILRLDRSTLKIDATKGADFFFWTKLPIKHHVTTQPYPYGEH